MATKMRACAAWFEEHETQRKAIEADPLYVYGVEGLVALGISSKEAERSILFFYICRPQISSRTIIRRISFTYIYFILSHCRRQRAARKHASITTQSTTSRLAHSHSRSWTASGKKYPPKTPSSLRNPRFFLLLISNSYGSDELSNFYRKSRKSEKN